jgi:hypothetical protein
MWQPPCFTSAAGGYGSRLKAGTTRKRYSAASIHSAAPRQSVSRCSGRKKPRWPNLVAPASAGVMVRISGLADIVERQGLVALVHPRHRGGDVERRPVRHRGVETDQRFRLIIADQRFLPAVAGAAVIIGRDRAAAPCEVAGEPPVDLARHGGGRIEQRSLALGPPRGKNRLAPSKYPSAAGKVMSSMKPSSSPASATAISPVPRDLPANANSAFAVRVCLRCGNPASGPRFQELQIGSTGGSGAACV